MNKKYLIILILALIIVSGCNNQKMKIKCPDGHYIEAGETCVEGYEDFVNDLSENIKQETTSTQKELGENSGTQIEINTILDLIECDFTTINKPIEEFLLSREELPKEFSKTNSWGDYIVKDEEINPLLYEGEEGYPYIDSYNRFIVASTEVKNGHYELLEFSTINKAIENFEILTENSKISKNIKTETGNYGEDRTEYKTFNPYGGLSSYNIYFRVGKIIFIVKSSGFFAEEDMPIKIATALHNHICKGVEDE